MRYFRSYIDNNNTVFKLTAPTNVDATKEPTTEILYGENSSKYIFHVNIDTLKNNIRDGKYSLTTNTKHYLHLTNCIFADSTFLGQTNGNGNERSTSFELIVFTIAKNWDEFTYSDEPLEIINTVHFDNGDENLHVDITDYVNQLLTDENINHGLGVTFHHVYNDVKTDLIQSISFFAANTQTFYEPYVESVFPDDIIIDNRFNFIGGQYCNLYLYSVKNGIYQNLDESPIVDIYDSRNQPIPGLTDLETVKIRKGVYRVTFKIDNSLCDGKRFFFDKWKNIKIYNYVMPVVTKKFTPMQFSECVTIGANPDVDTAMQIKFTGLSLNEKVKRGDDRRVVVNFMSINKPNPIVIDEAYYRLYIKENEKNKVVVYDWSLMDRTSENSFQLDTSFLIPREYYIEIRADIYGEKFYYDNILKFEIVSTKEPILNSSSVVNNNNQFDYTFNFDLS